MNDILNELVVPDATTKVTYSTYLKISELINLQKPLSQPQEHDEMLFIVIHQAYELWFKQILHELTYAERMLADGKIHKFTRTLGRVDTIFGLLVHQVDILETMSPTDFNAYRENLNPASGFQSLQFRIAESRLGARNTAYLKFFQSNPDAHQKLLAAMESPSVYDGFLRYIAKRGFDVPATIFNRPKCTSHERNEILVNSFAKIYQEQEKYYDLYLACEKMIDIDEKFLLWRYRHVAMVERMIGNRRGTGGSSGVKYLSQTLNIRFFPEIWEVRNLLGASYGGQ